MSAHRTLGASLLVLLCFLLTAVPCQGQERTATEARNLRGNDPNPRRLFTTPSAHSIGPGRLIAFLTTGSYVPTATMGTGFGLDLSIGAQPEPSITDQDFRFDLTAKMSVLASKRMAVAFGGTYSRFISGRPSGSELFSVATFGTPAASVTAGLDLTLSGALLKGLSGGITLGGTKRLNQSFTLVSQNRLAITPVSNVFNPWLGLRYTSEKFSAEMALVGEFTRRNIRRLDVPKPVFGLSYFW